MVVFLHQASKPACARSSGDAGPFEFLTQAAREGVDKSLGRRVGGQESSGCDRGYRVILVVDALCSSSDSSHDFLMELFSSRFSQQIETVDTDTLLTAWPRMAP